MKIIKKGDYLIVVNNERLSLFDLLINVNATYCFADYYNLYYNKSKKSISLNQAAKNILDKALDFCGKDKPTFLILSE